MKFAKFVLVSGFLVSGMGISHPHPGGLTGLTCTGTYAEPEAPSRTWSVTFSVITGKPISKGRGFIELLRQPNFPSGIRIAHEGHYLSVSRPQGATVYSHANDVELRIPDAQPPGTHPTGPVGTLTLDGYLKASIACDLPKLEGDEDKKD